MYISPHQLGIILAAKIIVMEHVRFVLEKIRGQDETVDILLSQSTNTFEDLANIMRHKAWQKLKEPALTTTIGDRRLLKSSKKLQDSIIPLPGNTGHNPTDMVAALVTAPHPLILGRLYALAEIADPLNPEAPPTREQITQALNNNLTSNDFEVFVALGKLSWAEVVHLYYRQSIIEQHEHDQEDNHDDDRCSAPCAML